MRIWITNVCSHFLDVQEANSRVSQQCRIRNIFFGRLLENGRYTSIAIMGLCHRNFWVSDAEGNLTRPSGKRHSMSHSIDHMSFDMVDHVPSNISGSSFPGKLDIFLDNEAVTHMIINGRSLLVETRVTNSPC